jgi:hypothetical protein
MPSASNAALLCLGLLLADAAGAQDTGARLLVQSSPLAGFRYYAAGEVWPKLKVGDVLELSREPHNPHDANAVVVTWRGRKLGYVPRSANAALSWALERGAPLRARISRLAAHPNPARRLEFEVFME